MVLTAENGDLRIKKGSGFSTTTSTGSSEDVPKPPKAPTAPNAPLGSPSARA